ncbi:hypothetical protein SeLEV6574_g04779 [Synchytrium endobioticum]|uniref:non-specific serine/threonine protein kinase n=1 Tax=Synchytrium endobioticum TaxID=286115 RepID=A0A507CXS4_9FUNG|nr:hypothetical protein SeLEV6574_g04779 [Synchytrium endobioticum]
MKRKRSSSAPPLPSAIWLPRGGELARAASSGRLRRHAAPLEPLDTADATASLRQSGPWSVVLHNETEGRVVLYKPNTLTVRNIRPSPVPTHRHLQPRERCTLCGHILNDSRSTNPSVCRPDTSTQSQSATRARPSGTSSSPFVHTDTSYFRLLASVNTPSIENGNRSTSSRARTDPPLPPPSNPSSNPSSSLPTRQYDGAPGVSQQSFVDGYYNRFFVEEKRLGRGYRGSVFKCQHILDGVTLGEYAVKKIPVGDSHLWLVRMLKEVNLLERLKHGNIVNYKHAWLENHRMTIFGPEIPCLFILMECVNGGNLEEFVSVQLTPEEVYEACNSNNSMGLSVSVKERLRRLREERTTGTMTEADERARVYGGIGLGKQSRKVRYLKDVQIWSLFLDIVEGLAHLHRNSIIHRDLKPPNLLLQYVNVNDKSEIPRVLISDFGECEVMSDIQQRARTGATGTLEFMPPELLFRDFASRRFPFEASQTADLWSLGIVLYYLCYSSVPYSQVDDIDILKEEISRFEAPTFPAVDHRVPTELKGLIVELLARNPASRPSAQSIMDRFASVRSALAAGSAPSGTNRAQMPAGAGDHSISISTPTGRVFLAPAPNTPTISTYDDDDDISKTSRMNRSENEMSPLSTNSLGRKSRIQVLTKSNNCEHMSLSSRRPSMVVSPSAASTRIALPFIPASFKSTDLKVVLFVMKILSMVNAHNRVLLDFDILTHNCLPMQYSAEGGIKKKAQLANEEDCVMWLEARS